MSLTANTRRLKTLSSTERAHVLQILLHTFEHSATVQPFVEQSCTLTDVLSHFVDAALQKGELWVTGFGDNIYGVAIWFGPGEDYSFIAQDRFNGLVSDRTKNWLLHHAIPQYEELYKSAYPTGKHTRIQAWHVALVAVVASQRRRGLGTSLVHTKMLEGQGVYTTDVSTSSGVLFFEKLGFLYKGVKNFVSSSSSGFPLWCMYRGPPPISKPTVGT